MADGGWHNDAPRTIVRSAVPTPTYFTVSWTSPGIQRLRAVLAFTFRHRSSALWLTALQLPQLSFAANNPVWAYTASSHFISGPALACRVSWLLAALLKPFPPTCGRPLFTMLGYAVCLLRARRSAV